MWLSPGSHGCSHCCEPSAFTAGRYPAKFNRRYTGGQKEYEVELQFSSVLANHPDRIHMDGEEYKDSENPVLGSIMTATTHHR